MSPPFARHRHAAASMITSIALLSGTAGAGGAACVMARFQGQTLDYALAYAKAHPADAQAVAMSELRAKGYADYQGGLDLMRAQNLTSLPHAFVLVIHSEFEDARGKARSAMGCGFSEVSYRDAELDAVRDLQAHYWGWKPDLHGYRIVRRLRY
jgi:hypothetical protein